MAPQPRRLWRGSRLAPLPPQPPGQLVAQPSPLPWLRLRHPRHPAHASARPPASRFYLSAPPMPVRMFCFCSGVTSQLLKLGLVRMAHHIGKYPRQLDVAVVPLDPSPVVLHSVSYRTRLDLFACPRTGDIVSRLEASDSPRRCEAHPCVPSTTRSCPGERPAPARSAPRDRETMRCIGAREKPLATQGPTAPLGSSRGSASHAARGMAADTTRGHTGRAAPVCEGRSSMERPRAGRSPLATSLVEGAWLAKSGTFPALKLPRRWRLQGSSAFLRCCLGGAACPWGASMPL